MHNSSYQILLRTWNTRVSLLRKMKGLETARVDISTCYCPLGCCRLRLFQAPQLGGALNACQSIASMLAISKRKLISMALRAKRNTRSSTRITALHGVKMHGLWRLKSSVLKRSEQTRKRIAKCMTWILKAKVKRVIKRIRRTRRRATTKLSIAHALIHILFIAVNPTYVTLAKLRHERYSSLVQGRYSSRYYVNISKHGGCFGICLTI